MMKGIKDITDIIAELQTVSNSLFLLGKYVEAGDSVDIPTPQTMADVIWANMRHLDYVIDDLDGCVLIQECKRQIGQRKQYGEE